MILLSEATTLYILRMCAADKFAKSASSAGALNVALSLMIQLLVVLRRVAGRRLVTTALLASPAAATASLTTTHHTTTNGAN